MSKSSGSGRATVGQSSATPEFQSYTEVQSNYPDRNTSANEEALNQVMQL